MIAAVRFTDDHHRRRGGALLLGPLAVDPEFAGKGFGRQLIAEALEAAKADGVRLVVLVGDEPYYGRFGFRPVPPGQITLPGPVDPRRLLAAELEPGALAGYRGLVAARSARDDRAPRQRVSSRAAPRRERRDRRRRLDHGQTHLADRRRHAARRRALTREAHARSKAGGADA